jgi:HSP20 family protein
MKDRKKDNRMKEKFVVDIGRIMDQVFEAAQKWNQSFEEGFHPKQEFGKGKRGFFWDENIDHYPMYSFPPTNVFLTKERKLVFEFALAGYKEKEIDLTFKGDHMILNAKVPEEMEQQDEDIRYFKKRLKFKEIEDQKYYVPTDKFKQEESAATYKNGILRIEIPPVEEFSTEGGIKVEIVTEEEEQDQAATSGANKV